MSKNDALETAVLNHLLGKAALAETTHMRIRALLAYTSLEAGTGLQFSTAGAKAIVPSDITVTGNAFTVAVKEMDAISAGETPKRFVLELSNDGGSTYPHWYYSDAADGSTLVPSGGIFRVTFSGSED